MSGIADAKAQDSSPTPQASPGLQPDFLLLPAYDLEREGNAPIKVGDQLKMNPVGFKGEGVLSLPPGSASLSEQGWALLPNRVLVPLKPGDLTLPSLAVSDAQGKPIARTNPLQVKVESNLAANEKREPVPMRPPLRLPFPTEIAAAASLLALALLAGIVFLLIRWLRSRRPAAAALPASPPKPEDEVALLAFAELEKVGLARKGDFKAHYFRVSEIIKTYIGARYRFDALESTSREILQYLDHRKATDDQMMDKLESLLERLDLVKFTDHVPAGPEPALVLEDAREWVKVTRRPGVKSP